MSADIRTVLAEITATLKSHGSLLERLDAKVLHLDEAVRGNGKPGMRQEIQELRGSLTVCQQHRDAMEAEAMRRKAEADRWWSRWMQPGVVLAWTAAAALFLGGLAAWSARNDAQSVRAEVRAMLDELGKEAP